MKNIFRSLGVLTLLFALIGHSMAQVRFEGKVRYAIEMKSFTAQDAADAVSTGYVDLWTYMCYSKEWVDGGYITTDPVDGKITSVMLATSSSTQSFKIIKKVGGSYVDDQSGSVASFAPRSSSACGTSTQQPTMSPFPASGGFIKGCPTWAYGTGTASTGVIEADPDMGITVDMIKNNRTEILTDENGKEWYAVRMYRLRFIYKQAESFYAQFYYGPSATGTDISNGSCTFNVFDKDGKIIQGSTASGWNWGDGDWSKYHGYGGSYNYSSDYFGYIPGGVEIIADPEFALAAGATCGGSDLQGSFKVNNWNGKSWSDYKTVKMYVNTAGGTRKDITAQTAVTPSLPLNTSSTAADFNYTLAPSAYMMNGAPADSLIWAFEDTKITLI